MGDSRVLSFRPDPGQFAWTFGGAAPVARISPGTVLDGHARQGEGETCGVAVECAMDTVIVVELLKGLATPWPRIESDTHIMSTGSARPLEDAFRIAQLDLVQWVAADVGLSMMDAYQFVSQAAESPLANVCDTNYTSVAKLRKDYLPGGIPTMRGAHAQLREIASAYHGR